MFVDCSHEKISVVNSERNIKYNKCILCNPLDRYETVIPNIQLDFSKIVGYDEIKNILNLLIENSYTGIKPTHIHLNGDPSTAKTVFLMTLHKNLKAYGLNSHYVNAESMTSAGVIDYLFSHDVQYLQLDELDKLHKSHQQTFLNLLENGVLQETKFKKTRRKVMDTLICVASSNYMHKILEPLATRFMTLYLRAYTMNEYEIISRTLLERDFGKSPEIALYITENVWNIYTQHRHEYPVIRNVVQVAKLSNNDKASVDTILAGLKQHSSKYEKIER